MKSERRFNSITSGMIILTIGLFGCQMSPNSDGSGASDTTVTSTGNTAGLASETSTTGESQVPAKILHTVCFKFKDDATQAQKDQHMADLAALKDSIPEIKTYSGAYTFEVSYEKTADYDCMHVVGFDSEEDLETYFHHSAHQRFAERNKDSWADVIVVNSKAE